MITGRRNTDWSTGAKSEHSGADGRAERRGPDRRATDRRAPRRPYDPLFVVTLINHACDAEMVSVAPDYPAEPAQRGQRYNLRA